MVGKQLGFSMVQYGALPNAPEPERCVGVERENCKPLAKETRGFVRHLNKSTLPTASRKGAFSFWGAPPLRGVTGPEKDPARLSVLELKLKDGTR